MAQIPLPDGRELEVEVSGPPGGSGDAPVLVFHHGTPGCVLQMPDLRRSAHAQGLRLVTWSRPGYAGSTRLLGRQVVDVVDDTAAVLDHLGARSCVVAGWSGGGPHALACGARLPERVRAVAAIASIAPYDAPGLDFLDGMGQDNLDEFGAAERSEEDLRAFLERFATSLSTVTAQQITTELASLLPEVDTAVLSGELGEAMAASFRHGLSRGVDGWLDDDVAFVSEWGFALDEIAVPTQLWQGSADLMVPFAHGRWLAERIPGVAAHLEDGEGHLSVGVGQIDRIVGDLAAHL